MCAGIIGQSRFFNKGSGFNEKRFMSEHIYPFEKFANNEYTFTSVGRKGSIKKIVTFEEIERGILQCFVTG